MTGKLIWESARYDATTGRIVRVMGTYVRRAARVVHGRGAAKRAARRAAKEKALADEIDRAEKAVFGKEKA